MDETMHKTRQSGESNTYVLMLLWVIQYMIAILFP